MRFDELVLRKYGSFEGCELPFPQNDQDFHIISGANEAGKSTAMEAVTDLLFGFPHGKSQDYKFDANLLRVAATLQNGSESLTVQRKRGKAGTTLLDSTDTIVPEGKLITMLGGQTRDSFRLAWSLSHEQLRDGGQSIAEAKDDIGQAIFAAGSGLVGVAETLQTLDAEIERIWKKKGSTGTWNLANKNFQEASQSVKAQSMRPTDWLDARDLVESLRQKRDARNESRAALRIEEKRIQRTRRLAASIRRFLEIKTELGDRRTTLLSVSDEQAFDAAMLAFAEAQRKDDAAVELIAGLKAQQSLLGCDPTILTIEDNVADLIERRGAVRQALEHIPKREEELAQRTLAIAALITELGLEWSDDIPNLLDQLPARSHIISVREQARECGNLLEAAKAARSNSEEFNAQKESLDELAKTIAAPSGLAAIKSAVITARTQVQLDEKLRAAGRAKQRADRNLATILATLTLWSGNLEELAALQAPSDVLLEKHRSGMEQTKDLVVELEREQRKRKESIEQNQLERQRLVSSGKAVTYDSLIEIRSARTASWTKLRGHIFEEIVLKDLATSVANYESDVSDADELADNRYSFAATSSRAEALDDSDTLLNLQIGQLESRLGEAKQEAEKASNAWSKELSSRNLPTLSPLHLREWLTIRQAVLRASGEVASAEEQEGIARQECDDAGNRLWRSLSIEKTSGTKPKTFTEILEVAEAILIELEALQIAFERHSLDMAHCERDLNLAAKRLKVAEEELEEAEGELREEAEAHGLPGKATVSLLDSYENLRLAAEGAAELIHRIETMTDDVEGFRKEVSTLGGSVGIENGDEMQMLDQLRVRLSLAKTADARASQIALQIEGAENDRRAAEAMSNAAKTSTASVSATSGETDLEKLKEVVANSRSLRLQLEAFEDLRKELLSNGDGLDIEAILKESEGFDPEAGEIRETQITTELAEIDAEHSRIATELGAAQEAFRLIDTGTDAMHAAADAEMARADMAREADSYLFKKAQSVILKWLIERQRQSGQSPLLLRASELFRRLTLNRYSGLLVDSDGPTSRLLGLSKDGNTTVPIEPMSDGTKDQLYLSLRIAAIEQSIANGVFMPFLADDLFINFDDDRAKAGFEILGELSRCTQVLFFTHHNHLVQIAREVFGAAELHSCEL